MDRFARIAAAVVGGQRTFKSIRVGEYIRSRMGEGYVVARLVTDELVMNMKRRAEEGQRVDKSDLIGVFNNKTKQWDEVV